MSNYIEYNDKIAFHPGYYIKEIIEKRKDWIEERIEAMQKRNISDFTLKELEDGNEIFYLGKSYMLKVVKSRRENIILAGRIMYMYVNISNNLIPNMTVSGHNNIEILKNLCKAGVQTLNITNTEINDTGKQELKKVCKNLVY